jgi:hypothetical protein
MVVEEHPDQDSVESAYGWHICIVEQEMQALTLPIYLWIQQFNLKSAQKKPPNTIFSIAT